jgi:hypothetical protein
MNGKQLRLKLIAANLVGMGALAAVPAWATIITNTLTADSSASAGGQPPNVSGPSSDSAYISNFSSSGALDGSSAFGSAWGNSFGTYRASADGSGVFSGMGHFNRSVNLFNNNGVSTDYSLTFFIYYGSISASNNGATGTGSGSYNLSIKQNNVNTLFASGATVTSNGTLTQTGTTLSGATFFGSPTGATYIWDGTYVTLDLGTVAAGDSTSIDFDLVSTAFGNFAFDGTGFGGYGGYGGCFNEGIALAAVAGPVGCTGSVNAGLGDPNDFAGNPGEPRQFVVNERPTNPSQVPLPGTLALLALGLLGLAGSRKSRLR